MYVGVHAPKEERAQRAPWPVADAAKTNNRYLFHLTQSEISREGELESSGLDDRVPMDMAIRGGRVSLDVDVDVALHVPASGELARGELRLLVRTEAQRGGEAEGGAPREPVPPRVHDASQVERREFRGRGVAELPGAIVPLVRDAHVRAWFVHYGMGLDARQ